MRIPLRFRSIVIAVSTPNPRASGRAASKAALVRQRWPFSGWAGVQPVARLIPRSGQPDHEPVPAAPDPAGEDRDRHVRLARGDRPDQRARAARGLPEVGVEEEQVTRPVAPGARVELGDLARPATIAAALPWFLAYRRAARRACLATAAVPSREPSSTTTASTPGSARAAVTVSPTRSASL